MIAVARQRNFLLLWFGGVISQTGDWMLTVGLPLYVYKLTGSTLSTSLMFVFSAIPSIFLSSISGVFVDRWNKKKILYISNLLLSINVLFLIMATHVSSLWIIYIVQLNAACIGQLLFPAINAFMPTLVDKNFIFRASALNSLGSSISRLIGPPLGGFIILLFGLDGIILLDSISFILAAGMIFIIKQNDQFNVIPEIKTSLIAFSKKILSDMKDSFIIIRSKRIASYILLITFIVQIGESLYVALQAPFISSVLKGSDIEYGWFLAAQAVGSILGSLLIARISNRKWSLGKFVAICLFSLSLLDLLIFNYFNFLPIIAPAIILVTIAGLPTAGLNASAYTLLQGSIENQYHGRLFAAQALIVTLATMLGSALAGLLGDWIGITTALNIHVTTLLIGGVLSFFLLTVREN